MPQGSNLLLEHDTPAGTFLITAPEGSLHLLKIYLQGHGGRRTGACDRQRGSKWPHVKHLDTLHLCKRHGFHNKGSKSTSLQVASWKHYSTSTRKRVWEWSKSFSVPENDSERWRFFCKQRVKQIHDRNFNLLISSQSSAIQLLLKPTLNLFTVNRRRSQTNSNMTSHRRSTLTWRARSKCASDKSSQSKGHLTQSTWLMCKINKITANCSHHYSNNLKKKKNTVLMPAWSISGGQVAASPKRSERASSQKSVWHQD